jgi:predicted ATPase
VLVGPNGSGKSSILQAVHWISLLHKKTLAGVFVDDRELSSVVRQGSQGDLRIRVGGTTEGQEQWEVCVDVSGPAASASTKPHTHSSVTWRLGAKHGKVNPRNTLGADAPEELAAEVKQVVLLHLRADRLAAPVYADDVPPRLEHDGTGLASVLAYLMTYEPERFAELQRAVIEILPAVERLRVRPAKVTKEERRYITVNEQQVPLSERVAYVGQELVVDFKFAKEIPAHAVSEGTLLAIGLLTMVWGKTCPRLVLLDDIEQGLHPLAQAQIVRQIRRVLDAFPRLQVVASSHSPFVVDEMEPDEVSVCNLTEDGCAACRLLSTHPNRDEAMGVLRSGEFWSAEGESWVRNGEDTGSA